MLLLYFIDKLFNLSFEKRDFLEGKCKLIQNLYHLFVVSYSIYAFFTSDEEIINAIHYIKWHCVIDLLFCSRGMLLHHFIIFIISINLINLPQIFHENTTRERAVFLSTEISSFFMIIRNIIPENIFLYERLLAINDLLFVALFFYTRIFQYSHFLIYNNNLYEKIETFINPFQGNILIFCLYSFYILNICWSFIIVKRFVKLYIFKYLLGAQECEKIIKFMYFTSPIISFISYHPYKNIIYSLDTFGQFILSISSFEYHNALSKQTTREINIYDDNIILYYLNDVLSINIRTFFTVFTNLNLFNWRRNMIINLFVKGILLSISLATHIFTINGYVKYIYTLKNLDVGFMIDDKDKKKNLIKDLYKIIPIFLDLLIILYNTNNRNICNNLLVINLLIIVNEKVKPFYEMTHLVFHILLFFQTVILCQANIFTNNNIL
jgi:hypothetical protein